jgi:phage terminase large subunit-like protein
MTSRHKKKETEADRAERIFRAFFTHVKGELAGKPIDWQPWETDIIRKVFGTLRQDGTRQYRRVYIEVARKNGKSLLGASFANYLTFFDKEPGAEIYSAAADRDQAGIIFGIAKAQIEQNAELSSRSESFQRSIVVASTGSSYKVLSADAPTKHGLNAHGIIFDELHAQPNRELWDVLTTATGARRQPLIVALTTAGYNKHSICWELHEYALKVRDGIIEDPSFLPVIYAADEDDDWTSPKTWRKANPNLGVSVRREYLEEECARAQETPAYENTFKRLHLNIWTEQATRLFAMEKWDACNTPVDEKALEGRECFAGLDLASTEDITALVLVFPDAERRRYDVLCKFWIPGDNAIQRERRDRVPYPVWIRQGLINATEGSVVDYREIRKEINELHKRFQIREIAIDRWNSTQLSTELAGDGFTMVDFGQGFASMTAPTKELLALILDQRLSHGGHPVLRWMASNAAAKQDPAGNIKLDKSKSAEKIDGMVALTMAIGRAMVQQPPPRYQLFFVGG